MRCLLVLTLLLGSLAQAEEPATRKQARQLVERGAAQYEAAQYRDAIESYRAAYEILPMPALLFNLAQSHRMLGNVSEALALYEKYLGVEPKGRAAAEAREHIAELRRLGPMAPAPPPVAKPTVSLEPSPSPAPPVVTPPPPAPERAEPKAKSRKWIWGVVGGVVAAVGIGLGVGLGVGLSRSIEPQPDIGTIKTGVR